MTKVLLVSLALTVVGTAQQGTRRATVNGNAVDGKCTIEVTVDGSVEVEVAGTEGRIRTLSGRPAEWRRFVCNGQMPANPQDFRFRGIDGRGNVQLVQDPRQNRGRIVFRIDDPQGGSEGYTVDLEWRGSAQGQWSTQDSRGWRGPDSRGPGTPGQGPGNPNDRRGPGGGDDARRDRRYYDEQGRWNKDGSAQAIRICQTAAIERIQRDGFKNVKPRDVQPDNNPGRNDFVKGSATAKQGRRNANFQFSCSVDLSSGQVRSVDVNRR